MEINLTKQKLKKKKHDNYFSRFCWQLGTKGLKNKSILHENNTTEPALQKNEDFKTETKLSLQEFCWVKIIQINFRTIQFFFIYVTVTKIQALRNF